jgi:hypothetical protein
MAEHGTINPSPRVHHAGRGRQKRALERLPNMLNPEDVESGPSKEIQAFSWVKETTMTARPHSETYCRAGHFAQCDNRQSEASQHNSAPKADSYG